MDRAVWRPGLQQLRQRSLLPRLKLGGRDIGDLCQVAVVQRVDVVTDGEVPALCCRDKFLKHIALATPLVCRRLDSIRGGVARPQGEPALMLGCDANLFHAQRRGGVRSNIYVTSKSLQVML